MTSHASASSDVPLPPSRPTEEKLKRDDWMMQPSTSGASSSRNPEVSSLDSRDKMDLSGDFDFFSTLGTERQKKPKNEKDDRIEVLNFNYNRIVKEYLTMIRRKSRKR